MLYRLYQGSYCTSIIKLDPFFTALSQKNQSQQQQQQQQWQNNIF